jgi:hypothetical protein
VGGTDAATRRRSGRSGWGSRVGALGWQTGNGKEGWPGDKNKKKKEMEERGCRVTGPKLVPRLDRRANLSGLRKKKGNGNHFFGKRRSIRFSAESPKLRVHGPLSPMCMRLRVQIRRHGDTDTELDGDPLDKNVNRNSWRERVVNKL